MGLMKSFAVFFNRAFSYSFYAIVFLTPLVLHPKTFELFEFNKLWVTFGISVIILFLWITKMILAKKIIFKRTPFDIPILLFLASQIISTIFSIEPHTSFWGYYGRFNGGLTSITAYIFLYYALISNFYHDKENLFNGVSFKILVVSLLTGAVVALWGFSSHFGYDLTCLTFRGTLDVSCWTDSFQPTVRLFSTMGQPNWLAAYFSILIPISLALSIFYGNNILNNKNGFSLDKKTFISFGLILLTVLLFIEVLWTQSQSGYAGLLIGFLFFIGGSLFLLQIHSKNLSENYKKSSIKIGVGVLLLCFAFSFFSNNTLQRKIPFLTYAGIQNLISPTKTAPAKTAPVEKPVGELGGSDSGKIRLAVWKGAIEIFKSHPLFGSGVETFAYAYYLKKPIEHNLLSEWDYLYNKAHNEYLNYLATTGIFGLGTYLLMIVFVFYVGLKELLKFTKSSIEKAEDLLAPLLILALLSGYISILVSNFFGFSVVVINLYFFLIPAFIWAFSSQKTIEETYEYSMQPMKLIGIIGLGIFCLYIELVLLKIWFADQSYSLGYNLDRAQEYVMANPSLEDAVKLFPDEDLYNSELSLNLATLGLLFYQQNQKDNGDIYIQRALQISDRVVHDHPNNIVFYKTRIQLLFILSQLDPKKINEKYYNQAIDAIDYTMTLAPTDAKVAYNAGLLYGQAGDIQHAEEFLDKAIYLKPNYKEPRYAISVYLIQQAKEEHDAAKKEALIKKAHDQLSYILSSISPEDKPTKDLLKSIE